MSENEPLNNKLKKNGQNGIINGSNHNLNNTLKTTISNNDLTNIQIPISIEPPDGGTRAWIVMISAFLCNGVIFGIINSYSVLHSYLQNQLLQEDDTEASSKAALVGSLTIGTTFLLSPIAGMLTDKIGLRRTTFLGGLLSAGGLFLSSLLTYQIQALYFTYGIMFGLGAALAYTPTLAILGHYFKRYLGKVSGFVTAGSSIFTIILPPGLDYMIKEYGLPITLQAMSIIACFIIICSIVYKPFHPPPPPPKHKPGRSQYNIMLRSIINVDIWKRKRYVIWSLCVPLALFGYFVPYVHMVTFIRGRFPGESENLPVMCIGISSGLGRLIFGILADMPSINRILLQQVSLICIGFLTMLLPATNSYPLLILFILAMGLFDGCFISLLGPIAYEICGPHGATQAIGFLLGLSSLPLTIGPPIAGKIYDTTGSYTMPFILAGIPPIVGAIVMFLIRCVKDDGIGKDNEKNGDNLVIEPKQAWNGEISLTNGNINHNVSSVNLENGKLLTNNSTNINNNPTASLATTGITTKCNLLKSYDMSSLLMDYDFLSSSSSSSSSSRSNNNNNYGCSPARQYKYSVL